MAIGNKLVRKQRVVDSLFKRKRKSLGEAKQKYVSLSNYLERANDKLEGQDDIADKDLKKLKSGNFQVDNKGKGTAGNVLTAILGIGAIGAVDMVTQLASKGKKFAGNMFGRVKGLFVKEGAEKTAKVGTGTAVKASKTVTREGLEAAGKAVTKEGTEQLAKKGTAKLLAKKLPLVGLVLGTTFAIDRAAKGDMAGAAMEFLSGAASTVPGWGTAASVAIDAGLIAKDVKDAVDNEDKGETTTNANVSNQTSFANVEPKSSMLELKKFDSAVDEFGRLYGRNGEIVRTSNTTNTTTTTTDSRTTQVSDGTASEDGTFNTGLKTGKSEYIGGSADYHIDSQFKSSLSMEEKVKMMDQLAAGYAAQGRNIEFSNNAVANSIWDPNASYEDKAALLQRAFEAHQLPRGRALDAGGFHRIDYYAPLIKDSQDTAGKGRFRDSVVGQDILIPTLGGTNVDYGQGGNYGAFVELTDKDGNILFRTGHGDIRGAKSGSVTLPERTKKTEKTEATSVTTETPPTEMSSLQPQENEIRKRVIPATSVRGKDKVVYERFDGERWMRGSGETAKEYKYLFEQQEYLRSEQGQINNPNQGLMVNDRLVQPVQREETDTNLVSQYTSYNNPRTTLNSTTIVAMGGIPGSTKTPMVMQTGGGSQTAIVPESANAMMMRLSQQMLFHKLTS
tara:strand:- start:6953 stop:8980 length:2028 start_codon:yes stop_codon:yes gene_type:complete